MAAEVNFGDPELFEVFGPIEESTLKRIHTCFKEDDEDEDYLEDSSGGNSDEEEEHEVSNSELREQLQRCQETIKQLRTENERLQRKLNILNPPSGISVKNSKLDGPLLQILFMNHAISMQCHSEIEDFVSNLVKKCEEQQKSDVEMTSFNLLPQPSSIVLEEDHEVGELCPSRNNKEAFNVVGNVLYFNNFCLDKLGQPLLNENPQLTQGWEIPKYHQVFRHIVCPEGQEIQLKAKKPKPYCFNCGSEKHQVKSCPMLRNAVRIKTRRREFMDTCGRAYNQNFQQRYHIGEVEERFRRFKPGVISKELQSALGVSDKCLPPFIYKMCRLGYPPGWLKEAEREDSGLVIYGGKADSEGTKAGKIEQRQRVTYDLYKLVSYPGFNVSAPRGARDEWKLFGSIPMQACQQKGVFASKLKSNFQASSAKFCSKRTSSHTSPSTAKKQRKKESSAASSTNRKLDSDMKRQHGFRNSESFHFPTPLHPPRPQRTPPPHFIPLLPKGTPPLPPQAQSKATAMTKDILTVEEPKVQQRWSCAALERAKSTKRGSNRPVRAPLTGNSDASLPRLNERNLPIPHGKVAARPMLAEPEVPDVCARTAAGEWPSSPASATTLLGEKEEGQSAEVDHKGIPFKGNVVSNQDLRKGGSQKPRHVATSPSAATKVHHVVPDLSKFATGMATVEFGNAAESTGIYLRIKDLLKNSPQNEQQKKGASV